MLRSNSLDNPIIDLRGNSDPDKHFYFDTGAFSPPLQASESPQDDFVSTLEQCGGAIDLTGSAGGGSSSLSLFKPLSQALGHNFPVVGTRECFQVKEYLFLLQLYDRFSRNKTTPVLNLIRNISALPECSMSTWRW
jgi:hypothetical protein